MPSADWILSSSEVIWWTSIHLCSHMLVNGWMYELNMFGEQTTSSMRSFPIPPPQQSWAGKSLQIFEWCLPPCQQFLCRTTNIPPSHLSLGDAQSIYPLGLPWSRPQGMSSPASPTNHQCPGNPQNSPLLVPQTPGWSPHQPQSLLDASHWPYHCAHLFCTAQSPLC